MGTDSQHFDDMILDPMENDLYIVGNSSGRQNSIMGATSFHQLLKARVVDNAQWLHAFCNPLNAFNSVGY